MEKLLKIHKECLYHEVRIDEDVAMLDDKRIKMYENKDKEYLREILSILNAIEEDIDAYREYILSEL